jgi:hypothetical protein
MTSPEWMRAYSFYHLMLFRRVDCVGFWWVFFFF